MPLLRQQKLTLSERLLYAPLYQTPLVVLPLKLKEDGNMKLILEPRKWPEPASLVEKP